MKIKAKTIYIFLCILIIASIVIVFTWNKDNDLSNNPAINEGIITIKDFSVNSDSTKLNTLAKGKIFIKGTEQIPKNIQIVAQIDIDPDDWGGVSFSIPKNWYISNITSSYPENKDQTTITNNISIWHTASDRYERDKRIEIGKSSSYKPTGGGTGTIVIDLITDENTAQQSESYSIGVAVGSDEKEGKMILGPDFTLIEIP